MATDNNQMLAKVTKAVAAQGATPPPAAKKKTLDVVFEGYKPKFAELLAGSGMSPERFVRILITEVASSESLTAIMINNPGSMIGACMEMASMGLDPSIPNEGWLIPYGKEAQFQPGYKGLAKLAMEAARDANAPYSLFRSDVIYANDTYERTLGDSPSVSHKPPPFGQSRGESIGYYALARDGAGRLSFQEMTKEEVAKHQIQFCKGLSNSKSPFHNGKNFDAYGLKTVVRRLCNRDLPMGPKLARALSIDKDAEPALQISPPLFDSPELPAPNPSEPDDGNNSEAENKPKAGPNPEEQPTEGKVEHINTETGEVTEVVLTSSAEPTSSSSSIVAKGEKSQAEIAAGFKERARKLKEEQNSKATTDTRDARDITGGG